MRGKARAALTVIFVCHCALGDDQFVLEDIAVLVLYTDTAMISIGDKRQMLRSGERSNEGVLLVSANSREAVLEYDDRRVTMGLSSEISAAFEKPKTRVVTVPLNERGQYLTAGSINGMPVKMLIDTGATAVAMSASAAKRLRLEPTGGRSQVSTAGGMVSSTQVVLDRVQVGDIVLSNVRAVIVDGEYPKTILLGMTFLRQVEIQESAGVMVLKSRL